MKEDKSKKIRTSIILDKNTYDQLIKLAELNDASLAWIIRQAIYSYIADTDKSQEESLLKTQRSREN